ncbi:Fis family transcriptional regulator [Methyloprofundus sedimenti]|uniref:Fis family transcriptional regulator n=1 Tax=Methyloprofundus sedimenti TaxID=1420851 RepID=A0A1V8M846_9GAMM|nr:sigma-54 dependent transcriptional regulator [Methyloprofundus sedimenti]OQK17750.1 Fis family transcriptional regulator [Methyloprofundus sedimenti]
MRDSLLIIEDETLLGNELARYFRKQKWETTLVCSLTEARKCLVEEGIDPLVVLSDMNLPDGNALDFLEQLKETTNSTEWLFLTGYGSVTDSVRAVRLGAYDFIEKPCELKRLNMLVEGAARSARAQRRLEIQAQEQNDKYSIRMLVGKSKAICLLREMIMQVSQVPFSSLIITGETGTGKGLITNILHYSGSRAKGPLIEINCAALPRELLESELFGYEAGAFTGAKKRHRGLFEQAHTGTLFLDEIGEMDLELQGKLLKAVEELRIRRLGGEHEIDVDVQIIAATNKDLHYEVSIGAFRQDLYHRLNVISLHVPPLRERMDDLRELLLLFIAENNAKSNKNIRVIPESVAKKLASYHWPGNIRELRNIIERCVLLATGDIFPEQWLQLPNRSSKPTAATENGIFLPLDGTLTLLDMEKYIIQKVLARSDNNVTAAARMLGTSRETLRYRVQKYHLNV